MNMNILWADDQADVRTTLASILDPISPVITYVDSGTEAMEQVRSRHFDLLILDLKMPPGNWGGLWLLEELRKENAQLPTLVLSGEGTQLETIRAIRSGASDYVIKERADLELVQRVTDVLQRDSAERQLRRLLTEGESATFECKETLRWNIREQKMDKIPEFGVAKTIAAFLNTKGGTLVVGVKDTMEVVGLAQDRFGDNDAILLHCDNIVKRYLGDGYAPFIRAHFVQIDNAIVLRIDCGPGGMPVYVHSPNGNDVEFYIRRQASSIKLRVDEVVTYVAQRFSK